MWRGLQGGDRGGPEGRLDECRSVNSFVRRHCRDAHGLLMQRSIYLVGVVGDYIHVELIGMICLFTKIVILSI